VIARTWHGEVPIEKSESYYQYLKRTGIPDLKKTEGNKAVSVFRRNEKNTTHFIMISFWDSNDSIKQFAGENIDIARYYPEDKTYLLELEKHVIHYEVLEH
jgi:heme-degrading monooxygenase HmoA